MPTRDQLELLPAPGRIQDPAPPPGSVTPLRPQGLRIGEAAKYLGVSLWTVQRLRAKGEVEGYHIGAAAMITLPSLDAFLERQRGG